MTFSSSTSFIFIVVLKFLFIIYIYYSTRPTGILPVYYVGYVSFSAVSEL